jgi:site-specific DNA-cytosine methylase
MNVLSLFDGMSCGQQALERSGHKVENYFASEIDKYAIQVTMANYPNTIQLGSVVNVDGYKLPKIDLLIGGSPCQSFSFAGKRKGMATTDEQEILTLDHYLQLKSDGFEFEGQSYLFWEYMRLLNECKPTYFLLENVEMGEKWEKVLSKAIGVNGIHINSALVSAQNRKRIYWFAQIRERLFYNDNYCYICRNNNENGIQENRGILGETQNKRISKVLGETQRRQGNLQNMQSGISQNKQKRDDKNLFNIMPSFFEKTERQEQEQGETENNTQCVYRKEQRILASISEGLQENEERKGDSKEIRGESLEENSKINENSFTQRIDWCKEEANKRRVDYHTKYGEGMCCVQCGKKLNHRPYNSFIEGWNESTFKSPSTLSEMQFNEARQNNGRVFDILDIGEVGFDLFGETINAITQPKDRGILLKDILEKEVDEKYYLSEKIIAGFERHKIRHDEKNTGFGFKPKNGEEKGNSLRANAAICATDNMLKVHSLFGRSSINGNGGSGHLSKDGDKSYCLDVGNSMAVEVRQVKQISTNNKSNGATQPYQQDRIYDINGISPALCANKSDLLITSGTLRTHKDGEGFREVQSGKGATVPARAREDGSGQNVVMITNLNENQQKKFNPNINSDKANALTLAQGRAGSSDEYMDSVSKIANITSRIRRLTTLECMRLQTVSDSYLMPVSDSQRYKMLGNGWTIETIVHIFNYLPKTIQ